MGTNYYAYKNICSCCNREEERLHIGKSSMGWCFAIHIIPEEGINTWGDWKEFFKSPDHEIVVKDEYGTKITLEELFTTVEKRRGEPRDDTPLSDFYADWEQFDEENNCDFDEEYNLLRHKVGWFCKKNGPGPYDYMDGEFS